MYLSTNTSTIACTQVQVEVRYDKLIFNNKLIITFKFTLSINSVSILLHLSY